jgi:hypothetical protein
MTTEPNQGNSMNEKDSQMDDVELERLGIRRVEREVYQRGEYVYSNLRDAIAAARREMKP